MSRYKVETEDGDFHTFEAHNIRVTPTNVLGLVSKDDDLLAVFASDQWLSVIKLPDVEES